MTELYDAAFWRAHIEGESAAARDIGRIIWRQFRPGTVVDIGCGPGLMLRGIHEASGGKCRCTGVDSAAGRMLWEPMLPSEDAFAFLSFDLQKLERRSSGPELRSLLGTPDVAICTEVAEHLSSKAGDGLVALLARLAPIVVWSAALPGHGGTGHVNEQSTIYWRQRFEAQGMRLDGLAITRLRDALSPGVPQWYRRLYVYRRVGA